MNPDTQDFSSHPADEFDPTDFEDVPTGTLTIKDPETGASTGFKLLLAGPEHPERKRRLWQRQRQLRLHVSKTGKMPMLDPEEEEANDLNDLLASVLGWSGRAEAFSPAAVRKLLGDPKRAWLRAQVRVGLDERELFIRRSATN